MIRFILKTIGNNPEFMTIDVKDNDFRKLNDVLQGSRFEIIGIEHFVEFDEVIVGDMRITSKGISFAGDSEPKFPEKYTPVIIRDDKEENWIGAIFYGINDGQFEGGEAYYHQVAPLKGNEHLINSTDNPPFWWIVKDGKPHLVCDKPKK
jgi:hypothetical protein